MAIGKRREGRQAAMQFLFAHDVHGKVEDTDRAAFWTLHSASQDIRAHAESLVNGIKIHQAQIDDYIAATLENFRFERLGVVDRNILRLAVYEMLHTEVPVPVVINEAVEISKVFGDTQTRAFVNGVLDKIAKQIPGRQAPSAPQP